ncbi:hypothetical protein SAMN05192534_12411 [Alteribacillus persepolensis]|uniref:Uncharacterized protein n=1 Tax=Alteribacillus persepolensis TaxID=568899 RepID=A0A1G8IGG9_9BACI|nr:hypothetical protein [Alteribacillus persepolensis]SDI17963.1 hypothetical protein SAMN05192534_12411 [Alteribacillus persepolensis]
MGKNCDFTLTVTNGHLERFQRTINHSKEIFEFAEEKGWSKEELFEALSLLYSMSGTT